MKTLSIIGCGKVGQTLARQWHTRGVFKINTILNRTIESAQAAASFIGAGTPGVLGAADVYMIAAADDAISACVRTLAQSDLIKPGAIVFHCSGAHSSALLQPVAAQGALTASLHPVKTFPTPLVTLENSFCTLEGDAEAVAVLSRTMNACGATPVVIRPENKILYHAGMVFACNYLTVLIDAALSCHAQAGLARDEALRLTLPLIQETLANIQQHGPARALTGPIARGDTGLVKQQAQNLTPELAALYGHLGRHAAALAERAGKTVPAELKDFLREKT